MQGSDLYSKFFEELLQRLGAVQYENTYRALSDYFENQSNNKQNQGIVEDNDDITDVKGIAAFTHYSIPTIYTYAQQNLIPYYRQAGGRKLSFSKKEVLAWIKSNRSATRDEIAAKARSIKIKSKNN